jgi:CubicO group peptidase (beta-lactamase class C family)
LILITAACGVSAPEIQDTQFSSEVTVIPEPHVDLNPNEIINGDFGRLLDNYFTGDKPLFSGSVLVAREGEIMLSRGYNYSNWELKSPNMAQTKYRVSSLTKPFTATLVMMLAEQGFLQIEDRLCTYLPNCPLDWEGITVKNLLNHTSGITEYTRLENAGEISRDPHDVEGLIDLFRDEPLEFSPGESHQYSNSNYVLLGALIEIVSGTRYEIFLEKAILAPLNIKDSGLDNPSRILNDRANGYLIEGRNLVNASYLDMSNAYATAGMYSTTGDLYLFDQALYSDQLLLEETREQMYTPQYAGDGSGGEYGLGWQLSEYQGHQIVGHTGVINGFHAYLGRYIDDRVTLILLSNIETEDLQDIVTDLEGIIFNEN